MQVGSFGDYVFAVSDASVKTFNSLSYQRASKIVTHATIEGLPVVEFLGLNTSTVTISGVFDAEFVGDVDDALMELMGLQDGEAHVLTRGNRCYGQFVVNNITFSEDRWCGNVLKSATWTISLVSTRGV